MTTRPARPMHAILVAIGTDGDVIPYLRLGRRLRARGHRVTLASNASHEKLAAEQGFPFRPLVSLEETERRLADPDFWHPVKGPLSAAEWGLNFIGPQYELLAELAAEDDAVLVAVPVIVAARIVQEKLARPMASLLLQPWGIPSAVVPPVMPYSFTLPRWAPRMAGRLYWRFLHKAVDLRFAGPLDRARRSLGLEPVRNIAHWIFSPQSVIGLFPDWYGPPQTDWPPQVRLAGFPFDDSEAQGELPSGLAAFCDRGDPPIVFTFGTGMLHARSRFRAAVDACRRLDRRAILLTPHENQLPEELPPSVHHCTFAPFRKLLPRCTAVVHHGGMGTLAEALACGTPQLILPSAHDQPDNAARIRRLGVGGKLRPGASAGSIARALDGLLTAEVRERCRTLSERLAGHDSLELAVRWLEELCSDSRTAVRSRA